MLANVEALRNINRRLRTLLDTVAPENVEPVPATPEQLAGLLTELLQAGDLLRQPRVEAHTLEMDGEINSYRKNVERLRDIVPIMQTRLLAERARLEAERTHLESAAAWARANRKTL